MSRRKLSADGLPIFPTDNLVKIEQKIRPNEFFKLCFTDNFTDLLFSVYS